MTGNTGAEIFGVDLAALTPDLVAEIRAILLQWKAVFFRDQHLTQAQHVELGRWFGEVTRAHPTLPGKFPAHPEILVIDIAELGVDHRYSESHWHTDATFLVNPPMGTILRGIVVPPYGGDTQFTNLAVAYQRLSPEMQDLVSRLHAVHDNTRSNARLRRRAADRPGAHALGDDVDPRDVQLEEIRSVHPVVRVHPETGERVLFVNPNFTSHIRELSMKESAFLLAFLYEHLASAEFTARFRWEPDSIAFWDNRATCHMLPTDVPEGLERVMQRITLAGDVPVGVDGQPSYSLGGRAFS